MPRRSTGQKGRVALVHALAHIEFNAIDLAWDMVLRFGPDLKDPRFIFDWISVAQDEALHFQMLCARLHDLGHSYSDLPAHDGLWQAAAKTSHHVLDRLAVIPMFLEARGIDTTPAVVDRLTNAGDQKTAAVLARIYEDEIEHLKTGVHWFEVICERDGYDPIKKWKTLVHTHLRSGPKGPFNWAGREKAGMDQAYCTEARDQPSLRHH